MECVEYNNTRYPRYEYQGPAARFILPFAMQVCRGVGVDVGCGRPEWAFPNSKGIDPAIGTGTAQNFQGQNLDYIFSSHCLQHVEDYVSVIEYWTKKLKSGGALFLYLPHYSQQMWRPWVGRQHHHVFTPQIIRDMLVHFGYRDIFYSQRDLYNAFAIYGFRS